MIKKKPSVRKKRNPPRKNSQDKLRRSVRATKPAPVRGALVVMLDSSGRVLRWNEAFEAACGYSPDELAGKPARDILMPAVDAGKFAEIQERVLAGKGSVTFEALLHNIKGTRRSMLWNVSQWRDAKGKIIRVFCAGIDITSEHRARELAEQRQQELLHMYRLHSAGGLAAAMAHELGQPLAAIVGYCEASMQALQSSHPDLEKLNRNLGRAVAESHRAANIIRELRGFIQQRKVDSERFEIKAVIAAVLELTGPEARRRGVRIETHVEKDLPSAKGRFVQIEQLLVNLLNNAIDSISTTGAKDGLVSIRAQRDTAETARISIQDSGPGLPTEVARRMFDPFFTTKTGGLGIGLMIARSIAEAHGSRLWAEQAPSGGTIFHFNVPFWH